MGSEFVRLNHAERVYGQKHMIQSQLELLNIAKSFSTYKKLRSEELKLKVDLKAKVAETLTLIEKLHSQLPKSHLHADDYEDKKARAERKVAWERSRSIQDEMNDLQKQLGELQKEL